MNAVVRALFDDAAITGAQAAGLKDTSTAAMQAAVREWFELFFMREAVKGKEEDPAQRIPYTITNKLTKACFAEYDSSFTENGTGKTAWLDGQRSLIDAEKQDVLQWVMVGGEGFLKPAPDGTGRLAYHVVRRDCYNVLARGPRGITDVLMSERSRAGSDYYTLLERRTVDGSGYLTIRYNLYVSENSSTLGHEVRLDSLPQYAALAPEHTYSVPFGGLGMTYIRLPMANNVDGSPDGVSVYEGAVQLIHNIYKNEYQAANVSELRFDTLNFHLIVQAAEIDGLARGLVNEAKRALFLQKMLRQPQLCDGPQHLRVHAVLQRVSHLPHHQRVALRPLQQPQHDLNAAERTFQAAAPAFLHQCVRPLFPDGPVRIIEPRPDHVL